jgi:hypothetical protein
MTTSGNLWAIGYDDIGRADQVREQITRLGWGTSHLLLTDIAVVVRHPDGSFTFDRVLCRPAGTWRPASRVAWHLGSPGPDRKRLYPQRMRSDRWVASILAFQSEREDS